MTHIHNQTSRLAVFVPKRDGRLADAIARGSGIVGTPLMRPADLLIDFEGNLIEAENIVTFADRCNVAAQRHTDHAPTIARMMVETHDVTEVGEFDGDCVLPYPDAVEELAWWLGIVEGEPLNPHELHVSDAPMRHAL